MSLTDRISIGGYTSYLRYMSEPCIVSAKDADIKNMETLGVSKINPMYISAKIRRYFSKKR